MKTKFQVRIDAPCHFSNLVLSVVNDRFPWQHKAQLAERADVEMETIEQLSDWVSPGEWGEWSLQLEFDTTTGQLTIVRPPPLHLRPAPNEAP